MADAVYRGVVYSGRVLSIRVSVSGKPLATHHEAGSVTVELDDHSKVRLEIPEAATILGKPQTSSMAWSEFRDSPRGRGFARDLEAPFAEVELATIAVDPGVAIAMSASQVDVAFAGEGGPREAPQAEPMLRASVVGVGPDAEHLVAKHIADGATTPAPAKQPRDPGDPRTAPREWFLMVIVAIIVAMSTGFGLLAGNLGSRALSIMAVAYASLLFAARPLLRVPQLFRVDNVYDDTSRKTSVAEIVLLMLIAFVALGLPQADAHTVSLPWALAWLALPLGCLFHVLVLEARTDRLLAALTSSELGIPSEDRWATFEGTVITPNTKGAVVTATRRITKHLRAAPDIETTITGARTLQLRAGDCEIELDRDEMIWCSTDEDDDNDGSRIGTYRAHSWIRSGHRVAASGRLVGTGGRRTLRSQGTRPAMMLVTSSGGRPLAYATAVMRHRTITLVGLVACSIALAAEALLLR